MGYAVLALTDHDTVGPDDDPSHPDRQRPTWPWQAFQRSPDSLTMVAVEGNEVSRWHHIGSYFSDYGDADLPAEQDALEEIGRRGGVAVLLHPGRYRQPVAWYVGMYRRFPHLIGLEIYNQGDRYPADRQRWDAILVGLGQERPVWGFSNDDMHDPAIHLGRNWNVLLLPALSAAEVRKAILNGAFLYVYAPKGHSGPPPPAISGVTVDGSRGIIRLEAAGQGRIEWIAGGATVHLGDELELARLKDADHYVRAVVYGADGDTLIGTQPFRVQRQQR